MAPLKTRGFLVVGEWREMGSYATLQFGHFSMGDWKSHVPLEPMILFAQEDYREYPHPRFEDATFHGFQVSAAAARRRVDARGLMIAACGRLYDEFRSDRLLTWSTKTQNSRWIANKVTFDAYLAGCKELFAKHNSMFSVDNEEKLSPKLKRIFDPDFFDYEESHYFFDTYFSIMMRSMLEVVPRVAPVV